MKVIFKGYKPTKKEIKSLGLNEREAIKEHIAILVEDMLPSGASDYTYEYEVRGRDYIITNLEATIRKGAR